MIELLKNLFLRPIEISGNLIVLKELSEDENQQQTNETFSEKWLKKDLDFSKIEAFQRRWYLKLYGFSSEEHLKKFLQTKKIIFDAGCGLGYKSAWFAELSPNTLVIGMDFSDAIFKAAKIYKNIKNLFFIKGDIAQTFIRPNSLDYINCDQVIHHTEHPEKTFSHLANLLSENGEFVCYVYAKKALPRELLDEHFRTYTKTLTHKELWEFSEQITHLGKLLSDLKIKINVPDIPLLNIKGGEYDLQRFIYWNFLKCFWNEELGWELSVCTNFDWYSPANAKRYSEEEFKSWITLNNLKIIYFHKEEACYSGRFSRS